MFRTWYFFGLTLASLAAAIAFGILLSRPVPEQWLVRHASGLGFVGEYAELEPVIARWRAGTPGACLFSNLWLHLLDRPQAYLPADSLRAFVEQTTPDVVESRVKRAVTILLSPCSIELKNRTLADPLGLADRLGDMVTPACTATCPALMVGVIGETKEAAIQAAEAAARHLAGLQASGRIGPYQSASAFLYSADQQAARLRELSHSLDTFQISAAMEHSLDTRKIDRALFRRFFDTMRQIAVPTNVPDDIAVQERQLAQLGLGPLVTNFFMPHPRGYVAVNRVLPAPGSTVADARSAVLPELKRHYIDTVASCPEYLAIPYYALVKAGLCAVAVLWMAGIVLPLVAGAIRRAVLGLVLGRDALVSVRTLMIAPGYRACLAAHGLSRFGDFARVGAPRRRRETSPLALEPLDSAACPAGVPGTRSWLLRLPDEPGLPGPWRGRGGCLLRITRADKACATSLHAAYRRHLLLRQHRIPVAPIVAHADGMDERGRCTVQVEPSDDRYVSFERWQGGVRADPDPKAQRQAVLAVAPALAALACTLFRTGFSVGRVAEGMVVLRHLEDGGFRLRIAHPGCIDRAGVLRRLLRRLLPGLGRAARLRTCEVLNRLLFMELFSLRDRIRLFLACEQRPRLSSADRRFIRLVARGDDACRYIQFARRGSLTVNLAEQARLDRAPASSFDDYAALGTGRIVTRKRGRTVVAIAVADETWYLKRHTASAFDAVARWREYGRLVSHARAEWEANVRLRALGVPVVPLVALGEQAGAAPACRSFIVTAELPGGRPLERLLADQPVLPYACRCELARRLGSLAATLHNAGFVHRDFYLGHLYVVGDLAGSYRLHVLDVQRLRRGAVPGNRWSVKDLTALHFSSLVLGCVRPADRLRVLDAYFMGLPWAAIKPFARLIAAKAARVARHTNRLLARRRERGELPPCNLQIITL